MYSDHLLPKEFPMNIRTLRGLQARRAGCS